MARLQQTILRASPRQKRAMRSPTHPWQVQGKPFAIVPICIAPVLPGETLKSGLYQARVVTDPIKNRLIGWWLEYFFFYVKHRDLVTQSASLQSMMLDLNYNPVSLQTAGSSTAWYRGTNAFDYVQWCLQNVVSEYFRHEGEAWNVASVGSYPAAAVNVRNWMDSAMPAASFNTGAANPGITVGGDDVVTAQEIDTVLQQWEFLRANNLTQMDYEDFLSTYGVRPAREEVFVPELIRYTRHWQYPVNTVEPTTGVPTSAVSWAISERIDKDRRFKEPGFIFGVSVARPKVYLSRQRGTVTGYMQNVLDWLPRMLADDNTAAMRPNADAALVDVTDVNGIWFDIRDLFLYGEQFTNFSLTSTDAGMVALPTTTMQKRYPPEADVDALFVGANNMVDQDGTVTFNIATSEMDMTGTT